jgi:DNA topoisomerase VI subunit A
MKQQYLEKSFQRETLRLIEVMNAIIDEYVEQGYVLTVRQLYYQLVARAIIENTEKSYKRITSIVNDAKIAGLTDWDAIEDRTRSFIRRSAWTSGASVLKSARDSYHEDMWTNQHTRIFVIVEKEALAGVLEGVCNKYDMPLLAARGYPSGTVLREFAESDLIPALDRGQDVIILHLGDHDPSGIDMTRDLRERLELFVSSDLAVSLDLKRIALNMEQIRKVNPPENPAKSTDSRYKDYRRKYGQSSWELDALDPRYLNNLIDGEVNKIIDFHAWEERQGEIEIVRSALDDVYESFKKNGL